MSALSSIAAAPPPDLLVGVRLGLVPVINKHLKTDPSILDRPFSVGLGRTETCVELAARSHQFSLVSWMRTRGAAQTPASAPALLAHAVSARHGTLITDLLEGGWDLLAVSPLAGVPSAFEVILAAHQMPLLARWASAHPQAITQWRGDRGETLGHRTARVLRGPNPPASPDSPGLLSDMNRLWRLGLPWDDVPDADGVYPSNLLPTGAAGPRLSLLWSRELARRERQVLQAVSPQPIEPRAVARRRL